VEYGTSETSLTGRAYDGGPDTVHEITLDDIYLKDKYFYRVGYTDTGSESFSEVFWFDNNINYSRVDVSSAVSPYTPDGLTGLYAQAADQIVSETGITNGMCLVYGCGEGRLAFELAKRTNLIIVGVDEDANKVRTARQKLLQANVYGARVTVSEVASLNSLPYSKYLFNLIVSDRLISDGAFGGDDTEMYRVLRPGGGIAYLGQPTGCSPAITETDINQWFDDSSITYTIESSNGLWARVDRPDVPGAGWWNHQYGGPENNGNSNDNLEGATQTSDMELQWIGWPGADAKIDRQGRAQGPVARNGRLIFRGFNRLIGMDSYNGSIYWSLEIPQLMRLNIPRDSGWLCIDDDYVYVSVKDDCWVLDANSGIRTLTHKLNDPGKDWGCVFRYGDKLYGSAVLEDSFYTVWWGATGWYDSTSGSETYQICSKYLFANNESGSRVWTYDSIDGDTGVIINSTVCLGGGRIYFVECRDGAVEGYGSGRMSLSQLWNDLHLVALDADTGSKLWEKDLKSGSGGDPVVVGGTVVFYLSYANENLFLGSSDSSYHLYAYKVNDSAGTYNWKQEFIWSSNNHGHHMDRPVVIGANVYLNKYGYDISTGVQVTSGAPSGSCGIVAGTADGLLYRSSNIAMWDATSGSSSSWSSIRTNCWINVIGSGGMVLAPEGGGGCDCYGWFHTSAAFVRSDN
jgi:SAM-dependent methyltransferase